MQPNKRFPASAIVFNQTWRRKITFLPMCPGTLLFVFPISMIRPQ